MTTSWLADKIQQWPTAKLILSGQSRQICGLKLYRVVSIAFARVSLGNSRRCYIFSLVAKDSLESK